MREHVLLDMRRNENIDRQLNNGNIGPTVFNTLPGLISDNFDQAF